MGYRSLEAGSLPASVNASCFTGASGVQEYHLVVQPTEYAPAEVQLQWLESAYGEALQALGLSADTAVLRRFFCSDPVNQGEILDAHPLSTRHRPQEPCAVSWIGQAPAPPAKLVLWAYHIHDPQGKLDKVQEGASVTVRRGDLAHRWTTGITSPGAGSSYDQSAGVLQQYEGRLRQWGSTLADNTIRTWFFVQNLDADYQGLVVARREFFAARGLTRDTHFIASTGIQGAGVEVAAKVTLDAYAISGVRPEQITYLSALDHLSPTHVYGVTFERATSVAYADRKHVFISGTASIDRHGEILHPGDVVRQLERTLENVEALLHQAGGKLSDMGCFLVYVRDSADLGVATATMRERFGEVPLAVTVAPVCRPGWLIEVEGMAHLAGATPDLPGF